MEPKFFLEGWVFAKPSFEKVVGSLPILPADGGLINGTTFGAKVVNVKWF